MRNLLVIVIIAALGVFVWKRAQKPVPVAHSIPEPPGMPEYDSVPVERADGAVRCDGRVYCSQMTSCEEATWFLKNCPGMKMDGNRDGVPCERQWCRQ